METTIKGSLEAEPGNTGISLWSEEALGEGSEGADTDGAADSSQGTQKQLEIVETGNPQISDKLP